MHPLRPKILILVLITLTLLSSAASAPNPQARWSIETIDAPMYFDILSNSMLQFFDGKPTMTFGGDHLYLRYWNYETLAWTIETVDPSPGVGSYASLARDDYGHTYISYYDSTNQSLKFATPSSNILFPGWDVETLDPTPNSGIGNSIAVLTGGQPQVSYTSHFGSTYYIKYVRRACTGGFPHIICSWSAPEMVAAAIFDGTGTSIAIASDGTPHISYVDASFILKHAYRVGDGTGNCGDGNKWQCETVPGQTGTAGGAIISMALFNDYPRIAFQDSTKGVSFAYQDAVGWHLSLPRGGVDNYGSYLSLALDGSGIPHISYLGSGSSVYHAWGSTTGGGTWTNEVVSSEGSTLQTAIAFDTAPCILYYTYSSYKLMYTCKSTGWSTPEAIAEDSLVGQASSLALDQTGKPYIAYTDYKSIPAVPLIATWSDAPAGCNNPATAVPWECSQLDDNPSGWGSGKLPSVAIQPGSGYPAVSYQVYTNTTSGLGYAWFVGTGGNCAGNSAWNCTTVESINGLVGFRSSLAFNSHGTPSIAYRTSASELKLAVYAGGPSADSCNGNADWGCEVVDTGLGTTSGRPSLVLDSSDIPIISYLDSQNDQMKLATVVFSGGTGCSGGDYPGSWSCNVVSAVPGYNYLDSSMVLASDSQVLISFAPGMLKLATVDIPVVTPAIEVVDAINGGGSNSLDLYRGDPWIAYTDANTSHALRLAHRVGAGNGNCGDDSAWQCDVLDSTGSVGQDPSLQINSSGVAYISYYDETNKDLKLAYTRLFSFMPLLKKP